MDLVRSGEKSLIAPHRRRKWLILIAISGVSGYGLHKLYHSPSMTRKRKRLVKIFTAIASVAELISDSAETISLLSRDVKTFLNSDSESDDIPKSLKQIAKIVKSKEFTDSLSNVSKALTVGVYHGYNNVEGSSPSVVDKVIDKAFSESGSGFISVVVGSFAKNLVRGFFYSNEKCDSSSSWVDLLCDEKCRELLADCVQRFTSTAVSVYLHKTMDINAYDQIFQGLTNPKHQDSVKDVLVSVSNAALHTLVKTSHEVFTSSRSSNTEEEDEEFKTGSVTGRVTLETAKSIIGFIMLKTLQVFRKSFEVVQEEVTERGRQVVRYVGAKSSVIVTLCLALYLHIISSCGVRNSPIGVTHHF